MPPKNTEFIEYMQFSDVKTEGKLFKLGTVKEFPDLGESPNSARAIPINELKPTNDDHTFIGINNEFSCTFTMTYINKKLLYDVFKIPMPNNWLKMHHYPMKRRKNKCYQ